MSLSELQSHDHRSLDAMFVAGGNPRGRTLLFTTFPRRFSFLCHTVVLGDDLRTLLIVNDPLLDERGPFRGHVVLQWLRRLRSGGSKE